MNDKSIEFHNIKDESSDPKIVRTSFRIPIEDNQNIWLEINSNKYSVIDIGPDGISIGLNVSSQFQIDQIIDSCKLCIEGESVAHLKGLIVHSSKDSDKVWQYGIQWIDRNEKTIEKLLNIIKKMKASLLDGE